MKKKPKYKIGIDTGTNTGFAVWSEGALQRVECMTITQAMEAVKAYPAGETRLFIEDARLWVGFKGKATRQSEARRQGAGSVKRDAAIWQDWCKENGYEDVLFIKPMGNGAKKNAVDFKRITGWQGRTNEHSRDAATIVYGRG